MNPLTLVKRIQNLNSKEATLGISEEASWHAKYKDSAYVFVGGIPYDLTEGDLLAIFAQYGEIVDVNLVRDKGTGKSKGFAFIAYEDQRSTNLAVDNLNGAQVLGRVIRVDHVTNYKKKEDEDEETEQKKREERGVCRAFQRGECNRGAGCKFSHDEQRAANTGWGHQDDKGSKWDHDRFEGQAKSERRSGKSNIISEYTAQETRLKDRDARNSRTVGREEGKESHNKPRELNSRYLDNRDGEKGSEQKEDTNHKEEWEKVGGEKKFRRHDHEPNSREAYDRREERRSRRHDPDSYPREDRGTREQKRSSRHEVESHRSEDRKRARDKWSDHDRDSSVDHRRMDKESRPRPYR